MCSGSFLFAVSLLSWSSLVGGDHRHRQCSCDPQSVFPPRPHPGTAWPVVDSLLSDRYWLNYSPAQGWDFGAVASGRPGAMPVSEAQLQQELSFFYDAGFRGLVVNAMTFGLENAPHIAKRLGFKFVIAKLWWASEQSLEIEKANLDSSISFVDAICVGNEVIQKSTADINGLIAQMSAVRLRYPGKPLTTGFQPVDWQQHSELATSIGDFTFLNLHPWWQVLRNDPAKAAGWLEEAYNCIANMPGMPPNRAIIVQELSFPSSVISSVFWAPGATQGNQKRFYEAVLATGVPFVWFLSG